MFMRKKFAVRQIVAATRKTGSRFLNKLMAMHHLCVPENPPGIDESNNTCKLIKHRL